jgi:hypothetical protein
MIVAGGKTRGPCPVRWTVLAIHGVGSHPRNEIQRSLAALLDHPSIDVQEFHWDQMVTHPHRENLASILMSTSADFIITANLSFEQPLATRFFGRNVLALHNACFVTAQILLAAAFVTVVMTPAQRTLRGRQLRVR